MERFIVVEPLLVNEPFSLLEIAFSTFLGEHFDFPFSLLLSYPTFSYKQLPHTSYNPPKLQVHYGTSEFSKGIEVGVSEVIVHPLYRIYREPEYDIAVLHLSEPFQASANASIIQMASVSPSIGSFVNVTGWGRPNQTGPFSAHLLSAENMVIVNRTVCAAEWPHVNVNEAILCAKNSAQNQAICSGDSGAGLTQNGSLVGVASFASPQCTAFSKPNGFADVANLSEFINKHLL